MKLILELELPENITEENFPFPVKGTIIHIPEGHLVKDLEHPGWMIFKLVEIKE